MTATTPEEQTETVERLKQMGILPEGEDPSDYPPLAPDKKKEIIQQLLSEGDHHGANAVSKMATASVLDAYDSVAERLEASGLHSLAAEMDAIGVTTIQLNHRRSEELKSEIKTLNHQLTNATDPEQTERLTERLDNLSKELESLEGPLTVDEISPPDTITNPDYVSPPNHISP